METPYRPRGTILIRSPMGLGKIDFNGEWVCVCECVCECVCVHTYDARSTCIIIAMKFTHPVTTTIKSIIFQTFRRYAPLCNTNPRATIFNVASTQNIPKKYTSVCS